MPLEATDARKLIRRLLDEGRFVSPGTATHARKEMDKDGLTDVDAVNVLRGGIVREPEWENGSWRYKVETPRTSRRSILSLTRRPATTTTWGIWSWSW